MRLIRVVKRHEIPAHLPVVVYGIAIVGALLLSAMLLIFQGKSPFDGMRILIQGAMGSRYALEDCLIKSVPLYLCSLGVAVAFRLQVWNIGAEGQFAMGAIGATWVALHFPQWPAWILLPSMMTVAFAVSGAWGLIPAVLKLRARANEIIITLMLNYIAVFILDYLVYGTWKDPASFGFPMTPTFSRSAILPRIGATGLNWGIALCAVAGILVWIFFQYTRLGYELKATGENVQAARYARLPYARLVILVMVISGGLAGLSGFIETSATLNRLQPSVMVGYGYTAIVVAWLARLNPLNIGVAAFMLAGLRVGVENLQLELQTPAAFGKIMEGMILLAVLASGYWTTYRIARRRSK